VNGRFAFRVGKGLVAALVVLQACRTFTVIEQAEGEGGMPSTAGASGGEPPAASAGLGGTGSPAEPDSGGGETGGKASGGESGGGAAGMDGVGGEGTEDVLSPDAFGDLVLWLRPATCTSDAASRVQSCPDQSGEANDAEQLDSDLRPKPLLDGPNGQMVLSFDGGPADPTGLTATSLVVPDDASLQLGVDDFTLAVVGRWRNSPVQVNVNSSGNAEYAGYGVILQKALPSFPYRGYAMFVNYPVGLVGQDAITRFTAQVEYGSGVVQSTWLNVNDDVYRLYMTRRASSQLAVRINGEHSNAIRVPSGSNSNAAYVPITIGGDGSAPLRGEIAELVLSRGSTTDAELARFEAGLMQKYALGPYSVSAE
jgi:hypothetical protein